MTTESVFATGFSSIAEFKFKVPYFAASYSLNSLFLSVKVHYSVPKVFDSVLVKITVVTIAMCFNAV